MSDDGVGPSFDLTAIACGYLDRGWSVVPVKPREKMPLVAWRGYQGRLPTQHEIETWFGRWPDANIGLVTGQVSNLVVLDIDPRHGGDASLDRLARRFGRVPPTLTVQTGGGGRHFYFTALAEPAALPSRVNLAPGIDVRAEGGMVVAPPSVHPSGRRYEWVSCGDACQGPAPLPRWLVALIQAEGRRSKHDSGYWRRLVAEGVEQGARNDTIASLAGHLMRCGVDIDVVKELLVCWNRMRAHPPLDAAEVVRTVDSIHRTHQRHHEDERV